MSDQKANEILGGFVPLSIDLGAIQLSLQDLLNLRPGMSIAFKKPERFEAALRVAGSAWADAEVSVTPDEIILKVKEIIPLTQQMQEISE